MEAIKRHFAGEPAGSGDGDVLESMGHLLLIQQRCDGEAGIDALLQPRDLMHGQHPLTRPAVSQFALCDAERQFDQRLQRTLTWQPPPGLSLGAMLQGIAQASGIRIRTEGDVPQLASPLADRPLPLRLQGLPVRYALCHLLEGTGLRMAMRQPHGEGWLLVSKDAQAQLATHTYLLNDGSAQAERIDPQLMIDLLQRLIDPIAWQVPNAASLQGDLRLDLFMPLEDLLDADALVARSGQLLSGEVLEPRIAQEPLLCIHAGSAPSPDR